MDISQETRERIVTAASQLYEQAGRLDFPTVDAVRRLSKTNMNDASAVMKEWRRMQTATAAPVAVAVPDRVQQASQAAIAALWGEAQGLATEALHAAQADWEKERAEAETLRGELSAAFEAQVSYIPDQDNYGYENLYLGAKVDVALPATPLTLRLRGGRPPLAARRPRLRRP